MSWVDEFLSFPYTTRMPDCAVMQLIEIGSRPLLLNKNYDGGKIRIGRTEFERGVAVHAQSCIRIFSPEPIRRFTSSVGVLNISWKPSRRGAVKFYVKAKDVALSEPVLKVGENEPSKLTVTTCDDTTHTIDLCMDHCPENPGMNSGAWAEAAIETISGKTIRLDELKPGIIPCSKTRYPFSFTYDGVSSDELLPNWRFTRSSETLNEGKIAFTVSWQQPEGGLKVSLDIVRYRDYPAVEILPWFENTSGTDTGLIENIQSLNTLFQGPLKTEKGQGGSEVGENTNQRGFYRLHKSRPDQMRNDQYTNDTFEVDYRGPQAFGALNGNCSAATLPFFKVDTNYGAIMFALGWLGQWAASVSSDGHFLNVKAGQELTRFRLHPRERIRQMRVLILNWEGDSWEANSQLRQLLYRHYVAKIDGQKPLPRLWVLSWAVGLSCFKDKSAENINYIKAYGEKLKGIDAYVTDGGWFKGGYGEGEGNYLDFDFDRWPQGVEPVLEAARKANLSYGLWFDVERTARNSQIFKDHPEWLLADRTSGSDQSYLLRWFGNPDTVKGTYEQTAHYQKMKGFNFYRQDYNGKPLSYWRTNDDADRQGIHEALHVMGLIQYWKMLADNFPQGVREECAGGGNRIDLDTISVMHHHQKSDQWGVSHADQSALMGLSHYLPNNCFHGFCRVYTEYAFRSLMAGSLCHGLNEIVSPDFDATLAQRLIDEYHSVRHLLIDAWYPLTAQTIDQTLWLASQYHRKDLAEGMILAYRRQDSPYNSLSINLRQIDPDAMYQLKYYSFPDNKPTRVKGSQLMKDFVVEIPRKQASEIMTYKMIGNSESKS